MTTFSGTVTNPRRHTDGTLITLKHPELSLPVLLPHGTDPNLTQPGARIRVTGGGTSQTLHADTVEQA